MECPGACVPINQSTDLSRKPAAAAIAHFSFFFHQRVVEREREKKGNKRKETCGVHTNELLQAWGAVDCQRLFGCALKKKKKKRRKKTKSEFKVNAGQKLCAFSPLIAALQGKERTVFFLKKKSKRQWQICTSNGKTNERVRGR